MATTRSISVPVVGGELYGEVTGPDPRASSRVVLLIADLASNSVSWRLVAARLPDSVSAIAIDLRGRGQSAHLPPPYGPVAHIDDLLATLSWLDVLASHVDRSKRIGVAGHGFGAFIAGALVGAVPDRLIGFLDVDGGVIAGLDSERRAGFEMEIEGFVDRIERSYGTREDALASFRGSPRPGRSTGLVEGMVDHELRGAPPAVRFATRVDAIVDDALAMLAAFDGEAPPAAMPNPVEWLRAGSSSLWSDQREPRSRLGNIVMVPGMDHDDLLHHPQGADAVARAITRMLTSERAAP